MAEQEDLHWATVWEAIADAIPGATAIVQGEVRRTWRDLDERAARLGGALTAAGLGPGSKFAQYLYNSPEYVEAFAASLKTRAVPVNVNYRYLDDELAYLLDNSDAEALVYHSSLGDRVARVRDRAPKLKLLIEVDDGSGAGQVADAVEYESLLAAAAPAPRIERSKDDVMMLYTGGTTGMPKGVVHRIGTGARTLLGALAPLLGAAPVDTVDGAATLAAGLHADGAGVSALPACPLMHGTGMVLGMQTALAVGGAVVLLADRRFDPGELWDLVERERVTLVTIVGDPFARPMLRALDEAPRPRDLSSVRYITSSGAMFSAEIREALLRHMPQAMILDYMSSSEGLMGVGISIAGNVPPTGRFTPVPGVKVFDEDDVEVEPGSGRVGLVGLTAGVPDGYFKDEEKSARTFRVVGGQRYSFPGDFATVEEDGSLTLLGRGSQCINTGGEKVFPEEVEEVLKRHPGVDDALVFGVPDERFGQRIVAVASGGAVADDVLAASRQSLASYKLPRTIVFVDTVPRGPNGKADYKAAKELYSSSGHP